MFDIVFPDGSRCFCTRVYLNQAPLQDEKEENCNHEGQAEEEEGTEKMNDSLCTSSEEEEFGSEVEDKEMKLMIQMGLPTSFTARSKMGSSKYNQKHKQSRKSQTSHVENTNVPVSGDDKIGSSIQVEDQLEEKSEDSITVAPESTDTNMLIICGNETIESSVQEKDPLEKKSEDSITLPPESTDTNMLIICENETMESSIQATDSLEKEIYWQKNKLWSDIDESVSADFKDYWERYGENILLHNWTTQYFGDNTVISATNSDSDPNDTLSDVNFIRDKIYNKTASVTLERVHCDMSSTDSSLKVQSDNPDCPYTVINGTCNPIILNQLTDNKNQVTDCESVSISRENMSSFCNTVNRNTVSNNEHSTESWDQKEWKNAWYSHVENEINKLYESFKKYYYTYVGMFEEDSSTFSTNEIICKLEELKELKFVISDPHPVSIKRRGHSFFPFVKWWKKQLERGYSLWETNIANALGYEEEEEPAEKPKSECVCNEETSKMNEATVTCAKENTLNSTPSELMACGDVDDDIKKYYAQRHLLFSLFHKGIKLDKESWYSVTPERIAEHIAERCRCDVIIDAFCGSGGNTIQFAFTCNHVIAIDWDPVKLELAKHNAKIYGVEDRIDFICANFMDIGPSLKGDMIFLSPPWGGPEYQKMGGYDITSIQPDIYKLFEICQAVTTNIVIYMPKSTYINQLASLHQSSEYVEAEQNVLNGKIKAITTYFGLVFNDQYYEEDDY